MKKQTPVKYHYFQSDSSQVVKELGKERLLEHLKRCCSCATLKFVQKRLISRGKLAVFFHSYMGQEAIQGAAVAAFGIDQWWATSYRCHALALFLGAHPNELMAELFGRETGNARGRGGSMHFFTDRLLGGFGIVGGQIPIGTGAAFTVKYLKSVPELQTHKNLEASICFFGDGAVPQGAFHESLNLASFGICPVFTSSKTISGGWGLLWIAQIAVEPIAETKAPSFGMQGYTFDGMNFFNCYAGFKHVFEQIKKDSRPVFIEVVTERFRGHSISDPGLYRSKESVQSCMERDPLIIMFQDVGKCWLDYGRAIPCDGQGQKEIAVAAFEVCG